MITVLGAYYSLYRMLAMTYLKELVGDYLLEEVKLKVWHLY